MNTLTVAMTESMKDFVEARASSEGFDNASDYVLSLIEQAHRYCALEADFLAEIKEDMRDQIRTVKEVSKISVSERFSDSEGMTEAMGKAVRAAVEPRTQVAGLSNRRLARR